MNVPEKLEVPVVVKDTDGNEHEVERLVYRLERNSKSRWHELFGTPEKAARTIADACTTDPGDGCIGCPAFGAKCGCGGYDALLEWLKQEVDA